MDILIMIFIAAIIMEAIDSSLGMMYGTILSPLLIGIGYSPIEVVPAILLSQAIGGVLASFRHNKYGNGSFKRGSEDVKTSFIIFTFGVVAVIAAVWVGTLVNKFALSLYIVILMLVMGIIVFSGLRLRFSWGKIYIVGLISSFNKALSGGGFGPIVTSGQMIVGRQGKNSVTTTTMSEVQVCTASFIVWIIFNRGQAFNISLLLALGVGAAIGGVIGPYALSRVKNNKLFVRIVGVMAIVSGIFGLIKIL